VHKLVDRIVLICYILLVTNIKEDVVAYLYIYSDLGTDGVTVDAPADYEVRLATFLRTRTKPLSVGEVAQALGGAKAETRRATGTIKVAKLALMVQRGTDSTYLKVYDDRKPGVNAIGDYRSRPKPVMMDGSCRG